MPSGRETRFVGQASAYYELMGEAERSQLRGVRARLERDPSPDGRTTHAVPGVPSLFLYDDGTWQALYTVPDQATILVRSIAHALDLHH